MWSVGRIWAAAFINGHCHYLCAYQKLALGTHCAPSASHMHSPDPSSRPADPPRGRGQTGAIPTIAVVRCMPTIVGLGRCWCTSKGLNAHSTTDFTSPQPMQPLALLTHQRPPPIFQSPDQMQCTIKLPVRFLPQTVNGPTRLPRFRCA